MGFLGGKRPNSRVLFSPCQERLEDYSGRHQDGSGKGCRKALITKGPSRLECAGLWEDIDLPAELRLCSPQMRRQDRSCKDGASTPRRLRDCAAFRTECLTVPPHFGNTNNLWGQRYRQGSFYRLKVCGTSIAIVFPTAFAHFMSHFGNSHKSPNFSHADYIC